MKIHLLLPSSLLAFVSLAGCGESGEKAAGVVEAASKKATEVAHDLADLTPEKAKQAASDLVDEAASMLRSIKDPATAEKVIQSLQPVLDTLGQLGEAIGEKLDLAAVQKAAEDAATRFKDDPRVAEALRNVREKIREIGQ